ncbi:chaperonin 10-like protein [Mycena latifolia]|nr:chaperonin 10-like protein [Mycena latifolia]
MALPATTRQWLYPQRGSYNNLVLTEVPLAGPKSNEVLVKTHAVSLQFRDLLVAQSSYPGIVQPNLVPCSDMAGEVIAVGADVTKWKVGDRVSANFILDRLHDEISADIAATALGGRLQGVLTEYRAFPAHSLVTVPAHLSYDEAATLPCAAVTAYNARSDRRIRPGQSGGHSPNPWDRWRLDACFPFRTPTRPLSITNSFALQFAVASGAKVIALSSSEEKLKTVKRLGAKHVVNYKTTPKWDEEVLKLTGGLGVDRVIEVAGNSTLQRSISSVKLNGSIDLIGHLGGAQPAVDIVLPAIQKGLNIRGVFVGSVKQFKDMNKLIEANVEMTRPVIDKVFPFDQAKEAYAYFESQAHGGKVVIVVQ